METSSQHTTRRLDAGASDQELVQMVQSLPAGDPRRDAACETLVVRYRSLVRSCVQRYRESPVPAEDLMQVGYVGLLKAITRFDPAIGDSLAAYARPSVSGEIKRYFRDKRWQVHVKRPVQELRLDARRAEAELTQQLARRPRIGEMARHLRVSEANVRDAERADQAFSACSLDAPLPSGDGSGSLADLVGDDDPQIQQIIDLESVWAHWEELPRREQRLLLMRFYGNMTQAQISHQLGISQMHVSRLLAGALRYLRQRITEAPAGSG